MSSVRGRGAWLSLRKGCKLILRVWRETLEEYFEYLLLYTIKHTGYMRLSTALNMPSLISTKKDVMLYLF